MKTKINSIKKIDSDDNSYYVIYFNYLNKEQFTYLTPKILEYFKSKYNITKLYKNQIIDIIKIDEKHYKIINIENDK